MKRLVVLLLLLASFVSPQPGWTAGLPEPASRPRTVALSLGVLPKRLLLVSGTILCVLGDDSEPDTTDTILLKRGQLVLAEVARRPSWTLAWDTHRATLTPLTLALAIRHLNGEEEVLSKFTLDLSDAVPFRISAPAEAASVHNDVAVRLAAAPDRHAEAVEYTINGHPFDGNAQPDGSASWNTAPLNPGMYEIGGIVHAADGSMYPLEPVHVRVISRAEPGPLDNGNTLLLAPAVTRVSLHATINPDVHVRHVTYLIDGKIGVQAESPPFESVKWDPSEVSDGPHRLQIEVTDSAGHTSISAPYVFTVRRVIDQPPPPQALSLGPPPGLSGTRLPAINVDLLRRQARAMANSSQPRRGGVVGRANGLAVLVTSVGGVPVDATGTGITIEARALPGSGQTQFIAYADADARTAAERAVAYCKAKVGELGYITDWSAWDLVVSYQENAIKNEGASAGITDAVAVMSALLKEPVDQTVAMTGQIQLNGEVDAVAGVDFKAEYALSRPDVQTVIIPAKYTSVAELADLYIVRPELFAGKRIIIAANMDQVLRQALIGYDEKTYEAARAHVVSALKLFGAGKDSMALNELSAATQLTPEDATIAVNFTLIQEAMRVGTH